MRIDDIFNIQHFNSPDIVNSIEIRDEDEVILSNELVEARYLKTLNLEESKIVLVILKLLKKISKDELDLNNVLIYIKKSALVNTVCENHYNIVNQALNKLVSNNVVNIVIDPSGKRGSFAWFSYAIDRGEVIEIKINPDLLKYLLQLHMGYTRVLIKPVFNFKSKYSQRLYELLARYRDTNWRSDSVSSLRMKLGVEDHEYKIFKDFENRVIKPAVKDINEHTELEVSYEKIKTKNKTTHIKFYISLKSKLEAIKVESSQEDGIRLVQVLPEQDKQEEINKIKKQLQAMFDSAYKVMLRNDNDRIRSVEAVYKTIKEEEKNQKVIEKVQEYQQEYPEMLRNSDYAMLGPKGKFIWIFSNEEQRMKLIKLYKKKNELENKIRESNGEL